MISTRIKRHINAPAAAVYRALLDPRAVAKWKVPDGMTCQVPAFDSANPVRYVATRINPNAPGGRGATTGGDATRLGRQHSRGRRILRSTPHAGNDTALTADEETRR